MNEDMKRTLIEQIPQLVSILVKIMPEIGILDLTVKGTVTDPDDATTTVEISAEFAGLVDGSWALEELWQVVRKTERSLGETTTTIETRSPEE